MDRNEFLSTSLKAGVCCGAVAFLRDRAAFAEGVAPAAKAPAEPKPSASPPEKRVDFAKTWVKRFMDILDSRLDEETRKGIMEENGRVCFCGAHGEFDPSSPPPDLDRWHADMEKRLGPENFRREGKTFFFSYGKNPGGYCLCPVVEDGPPELSPTYCHCSVGYVRELFRRAIRTPLDVELLASVHRGDPACRFKITVQG